MFQEIVAKPSLFQWIQWKILAKAWETRKVQQAVGEGPRESLRALVQSQQRFNKVLANIPEMVGAVLEQSKALLAIAFLDKSFDGAAEAYFGWDGLCKFIRCHWPLPEEQ